MKINIATFDHPRETLCPLVEDYHTGVEIQSFCGHETLDTPDATLADIDRHLPKSNRAMHGYFYSMNPSAYDPLIRVDQGTGRYHPLRTSAQ